MTVGLPGAGIGGLFYLIAGLAMPLRETWLTVTGRSSRARWRVVLHQFSLAGGIAVGTWASGWLLTAAVLRLTSLGGGTLVPGTGPVGASSLQQAAEWLRPTHGIMQLATLATVLVGAWALGTLLGRSARATPAGRPALHVERGDAARPVERRIRHRTGEVRIPTPGPRVALDLRAPTRTPTPGPMPGYRRAAGEG